MIKIIIIIIMIIIIILTQDEESPTVDEETPGVVKMTLNDIRRSQAGVYTCTANNSVGSDSKSVTVQVNCKRYYSD